VASSTNVSSGPPGDCFSRRPGRHRPEVLRSHPPGACAAPRQAAGVAPPPCSKRVPVARLGVHDPSRKRQVRCAHRWDTPTQNSSSPLAHFGPTHRRALQGLCPESLPVSDTTPWSRRHSVAACVYRRRKMTRGICCSPRTAKRMRR
jgi:hypothetical protein